MTANQCEKGEKSGSATNSMRRGLYHDLYTDS